MSKQRKSQSKDKNIGVSPKLAGDQRDSPFSLSIDASSDVHGNSYLAISARYLEEENHDRPVTRLYSILPITTSSTGETFYKMIMDEILVDEEITSNFVGIGTDDGGNMTGQNEGVSQRLRESFNYIVNMKDISHGLNNIFKKALKAIDVSIQNVIKGISSHFHHSTKSTSILRQTLLELRMKPLEILHQSATRKNRNKT